MKKLSTQRLLAGMGQLIKPASMMILAMASTLAIHEATAHGYVLSPKSRIIQCRDELQGTVPDSAACLAWEAMGNAGIYTPQEIAVGGVRDNHMSFIPDGKLCSVGRGGYLGLDLARNDWVATSVRPGPLQFHWHNTAAHKTKYFRYYITREGFNPGAAELKWSDLEQIHQSLPAPQEVDSYHTVNLPQRTGRHIVYSIWQRDWDLDAAEGFYQCIDVDFGGGSNSSASVSSSSRSSTSVASSSSSTVSSVSPDTCVSLLTWSSGETYQPPMSVKHNGKRYQAAYWTSGDNPTTKSGYQGAPWIDLGACNGTLSSSSVGVSSSSRSSAVSSVASSMGGNCSSPQYVNGSTYATGALVKNAGNEYRCTVGGWCTVGGPYEPGVGWAWNNAWVLVRSCQ